MYEVATNEDTRIAIQRAHSERAAAFAAGIAWVRSLFTARPHGAGAHAH